MKLNSVKSERRKIMLKTSLLIASIMFTCIGFAGPRPMHRSHHRPAPRIHHHPPVHHHRHVHRPHHHHSPIIPIVSGVVGGMIANAIVNSTTPTVIDTTPVVVQSTPVVVRGVNTVWQPGHYENQVQPNGTVIRVWVPGRYVVVP